MDPDMVDFRYNVQNLVVYNCEFLKMMKHEEGLVARKLFNIKKDPITRSSVRN
jgi:hypothetical protein